MKEDTVLLQYASFKSKHQHLNACVKSKPKNHKYKCGWEPGAMTQLWEDTTGFKD